MKRLLYAERYKLYHDRIFWITLTVTVLFNSLMFSGSTWLNLSGQKVLIEVMRKEIPTVLIACIYGGLFIGGDFADCTLYYALMAGKSRASVLFAKFIIFVSAIDIILFVFPLLFIIVSTLKNGWGTTLSGDAVYHLTGMIAALLILGFSIGTFSLFVAVCFRDVGRTIGVPVFLYFIMIILLNSTYSAVFSRIFPVGAMVLVVNGTFSPAYGILLGIVWMVILFIISVLIFRRAELR